MLQESFYESRNAHYKSSIPNELFSSRLDAFWLSRELTQENQGLLTIFSDCNIKDNAFFAPSRSEICLGKVSTVNNVYIVEDPTVTWHENGHVFNQVIMNIRGKTSGINFLSDSNLGYLFYDEAGAIGEGISDFWSFTMNQRTHFGEWALGRFLNASRPLSEDDPLHAPGVSPDAEGRLSYPQYLNYDVNNHTSNYESVHNAGQIISHFFNDIH